MNEEITMTAMPEDTAPETESTSAMEDDWDDIDLSDVTDDDTEGAEQEETHAETESELSEADQQTEEPGEAQKEEAPAAEEQAAEEPAEQTFDLKFLGETKTVSKDEVIVLAQKGLNHDKVLRERDEARGEITRLKEYETFLKELAGPDGMSIEDLMDSTRAEVLAKKEGIDKAAALRQIKLDRREKAFEAKRSQEEAAKREAEEADRQRSQQFLKFHEEYPDVDPKDIPKEVWDKFRDGMPLITAYSAYENKKLREEVKSWKDKAETAEQNYKNQQRSTGSQSTAGVGSTQKKDPIDLDWYSGD
jgi:hypothetical protein